jgi:glutamyl-tRNA synthetase/glutamyl-Q tRNA(Asp) synthetase
VLVLLRLEDLDPERCRPAWSDGMCEALAWLGLDWDETVVQSARAVSHGASLDRLAEQGRLYPCRCTRSDLRERGRALPEGGFAYPGTCRDRPLPAGGWRSAPEALRVRLPEGTTSVSDEAGGTLSGNPAREPGDPVVRRRDGAVAYHLARVVDDGEAGVTRVVRGRDLASTTTTQVALQHLLDFGTPTYRHHLLLTSRPRCGAARRCAADDTPRPATRLRLVARASPRPHAALDGERASGVGGRELMSRASPQRSPAPALSNVPAPSITTPGSP